MRAELDHKHLEVTSAVSPSLCGHFPSRRINLLSPRLKSRQRRPGSSRRLRRPRRPRLPLRNPVPEPAHRRGRRPGRPGPRAAVAPGVRGPSSGAPPPPATSFPWSLCFAPRMRPQTRAGKGVRSAQQRGPEFALFRNCARGGGGGQGRREGERGRRKILATHPSAKSSGGPQIR